jgi:two-component system, NarL family, nitrate/nitrite response regulator NarL
MRARRDRGSSTDVAAEPRPPAEDQRGTASDGPRIVIASELRLLRDGLADALARRRAMRVVAVTADADGARAAAGAHGADVVLLDVALDGALALVRELASHATLRVIAVAVADDEDDLVACIEAGASGYIARDGTIDDVVAAVRSVGRGETICSPRLAASLFRRLAGLERERRAHRRDDALHANAAQVLSPRECEILALIEQGLANKEIASRLGIEIATVKNHVHRILEKLHVTRRGQAVARARTSAG